MNTMQFVLNFIFKLKNAIIDEWIKNKFKKDQN